MGPSAGYLFGFVAAAFVVGWLAERGWDRHIWTAIIAMIAGSAVMYMVALPWLALFVHQSTLLQTGLYPFIIGDLLKIVAAAIALPSGWFLLHRVTG
jgi:biotin transporter BioY